MYVQINVGYVKYCFKLIEKGCKKKLIIFVITHIIT